MQINRLNIIPTLAFKILQVLMHHYHLLANWFWKNSEKDIPMTPDTSIFQQIRMPLLSHTYCFTALFICALHAALQISHSLTQMTLFH